MPRSLRMTLDTKKLDDVLASPSSHYSSPMQVADASDLSDDQKKMVLDKWEEDARRLAVATEEGMSGGEPSYLAEVQEAKAKLKLFGDRKAGPAKAG
jgi:hypothetical protein